MDVAKYRAIFVEESTENLAEISSALLALEKDPACGEAIDSIFRMAHSIKGMAASLEYDSITELAHSLEDHMEEVRNAGCVGRGGELALLFRGLEALEAMVATVRETGEAPPPQHDLAKDLSAVGASPAPPTSESKKKALLS